jgi:hypothetical protein
MERDGSGVSALLGLDGFVVSAQVLDEASGEWWLAVETTEDRTLCESCGVRAIGHGPPPGRGGGSAARRSAGDAGVGQALVALRRRVRPGLVGGVRGDRATGHAHRAGSGGDLSWCRSAEPSVAQAARDFGVSWHAAMAAVRDHGRPRVDHLARLGAPSAVGLGAARTTRSTGSAADSRPATTACARAQAQRECRRRHRRERR